MTVLFRFFKIQINKKMSKNVKISINRIQYNYLRLKTMINHHKILFVKYN